MEGIITRAIAGLSQDQKKRREDHPEAADQLDAFVTRLHTLMTLEKPWTLKIEDISGESLNETMTFFNQHDLSNVTIY